MMTPRAMPEDAATALKAAHAALPHAAAFQAMPSADRTALQANLSRVRQALVARPQNLTHPSDPYDRDVLAGAMIGPQTGYSRFGTQPDAAPTPDEPTQPQSLLRTINDMPAATGAMMDEIGFADFVASLIHGTFDAIVDSSIRQMEAFADLVSSLSKTVDDFSRDNVTDNQVKDWLIDRYPADLQLILPTASGEVPRVMPRTADDDWGASPAWLGEFDLAGETLSEELIETRLVPAARNRLGEDRMRSLASMALMGLHKVKVERGEINASVRIRAKARDAARVGFAQDQDPQGSSWSGRSGFSAPVAQAMVSTSVNAQSDAAIQAELKGEVRVVFASETVPLESFISDAQRVLLERTARQSQAAAASPQASVTVDQTPTQLQPQPPATPEPEPQPPAGGSA